ncbi:hypothetical protein [Paraburkholderia sp. J41]|uniref:hypothetical protein n=1 Tax=Paraburkholderia sp. J41 TaxID=2805433 RepID=UPI0039F55629
MGNTTPKAASGYEPKRLFFATRARSRPHGGLGRSGALAPRAGHDLDGIALSGMVPGVLRGGLSGALRGVGGAGEARVPPLSFIGDHGGGMPLAPGV